MQELASLRYLIVDDSPTMRRIVVNALSSFGVSQIVEAADGRDAAEKILSTQPDFVITDWNMPNMTGLDLTRWIRSNDVTKHLPVLMVTTRDNKDDVMEALKVKVNNYIVKPFTPQNLKDKINLILQALATASQQA